MKVEELANEKGIPVDKAHIEELTDAFVEENDFVDGDRTMARTLVESAVMKNMHLEEILEWKIDAFDHWDGNPGTGADAHAYFEDQGKPILDSIIEDHNIKWYCDKGRQDYRITNEREQDGYRILTLKRT